MATTILKSSPEARARALRRAVLGPPGALVRLTAGQQRARARREAIEAVGAGTRTAMDLTPDQRSEWVALAVAGEPRSLTSLRAAAAAGDPWCLGALAVLTQSRLP